MIQIRPVSDLRNKFPELESVIKSGQPVYLTKNGYGTMVVMSLDMYSELIDDAELKLDEADFVADVSKTRYTHNDVFNRLKDVFNG